MLRRDESEGACVSKKKRDAATTNDHIPGKARERKGTQRNATQLLEIENYSLQKSPACLQVPKNILKRVPVAGHGGIGVGGHKGSLVMFRRTSGVHLCEL